MSLGPFALHRCRRRSKGPVGATLPELDRVVEVEAIRDRPAGGVFGSAHRLPGQAGKLGQ